MVDYDFEISKLEKGIARLEDKKRALQLEIENLKKHKYQQQEQARARELEKETEEGSDGG